MTFDDYAFLQSVLESWGVNLTARALAELRIYHELLREWNQRVNLISRQDTDRIVSYHFVDSLAVLPLIPVRATVADLGTGGGLPGIPVKIVRPDITLLLVESVRRKVLFLDEAVRRLGLQRTSVLNLRLTHRTCLSDTCDVILCRLVGRIAEVLPVVYRQLPPGGQIVFYKSDQLTGELAQAEAILKRLGLQLAAIHSYELPAPLRLRRKLAVITRSAE